MDDPIDESHSVETRGGLFQFISSSTLCFQKIFEGEFQFHGLRTPNEGINQRNRKFWADVADKICFGRT